MAHQNPLPYSAAIRQLNALVRKYNQATADSLGFKLGLFVDKPEKPNIIEYTLVMKSQCDTAWEVRRISSSLFMNLQLDFMDKSEKYRQEPCIGYGFYKIILNTWSYKCNIQMDLHQVQLHTVNY